MTSLLKETRFGINGTDWGFASAVLTEYELKPDMPAGVADNNRAITRSRGISRAADVSTTAVGGTAAV